MKRRFLTILSIVCIAFIALSDSVAADPNRRDVAQAIAARTGPGTSVNKFDFKVFSSGGSGRVSVAGTLMITEHRYQSMKHVEDDFIREAISKGVKREDYKRYAYEIGMNNYTYSFPKYRFVEIVKGRGSIVPFEAELRYVEKVNGFSFMGAVDADLPGFIESKSPKPIITLGSPRYKQLMGLMVAKARTENEDMPNKFNVFLEFLNNGLEIHGKGGPAIEVKGFDPKTLEWEKGRVINGRGQEENVHKARIEVMVRSLTGGPVKFRNYVAPPSGFAKFKMALVMPLTGNVEDRACIDIGFGMNPLHWTCWDGTAYTQQLGRYGWADAWSISPRTAESVSKSKYFELAKPKLGKNTRGRGNCAKRWGGMGYSATRKEVSLTHNRCSKEEVLKELARSCSGRANGCYTATMYGSKSCLSFAHTVYGGWAIAWGGSKSEAAEAAIKKCGEGNKNTECRSSNIVCN